jgi:hypothetical protein
MTASVQPLSEQRIYFALSGDEIKIGVTRDPTQRVAAMRTARPDIKLFGDIPGDRYAEAALHRRFSQERISGEWFHFSSEIELAINELLSKTNGVRPETAKVHATPPRRPNARRATSASMVAQYEILVSIIRERLRQAAASLKTDVLLPDLVSTVTKELSEDERAECLRTIIAKEAEIIFKTRRIDLGTSKIAVSPSSPKEMLEGLRCQYIERVRAFINKDCPLNARANLIRFLLEEECAQIQRSFEEYFLENRDGPASPEQALSAELRYNGRESI